MKIFCAGCLHDGKPALLGERPPLDDSRGTHGLCHGHLLAVGLAVFLLGAAGVTALVARDDARGRQDEILAPFAIDETPALLRLSETPEPTSAHEVP